MDLLMLIHTYKLPQSQKPRHLQTFRRKSSNSGLKNLTPFQATTPDPIELCVHLPN